MRKYLLLLLSALLLISCEKDDSTTSIEKKYSGQIYLYHRHYLGHSQTVVEDYDTAQTAVTVKIEGDSIFFNPENDTLIQPYATTLGDTTPGGQYYITHARIYNFYQLKGDQLIYYFSFYAPGGPDAITKDFSGSLVH